MQRFIKNPTLRSSLRENYDEDGYLLPITGRNQSFPDLAKAKSTSQTFQKPELLRNGSLNSFNLEKEVSKNNHSVCCSSSLSNALKRLSLNNDNKEIRELDVTLHRNKTRTGLTQTSSVERINTSNVNFKTTSKLSKSGKNTSLLDCEFKRKIVCPLSKTESLSSTEVDSSTYSHFYCSLDNFSDNDDHDSKESRSHATRSLYSYVSSDSGVGSSYDYSSISFPPENQGSSSDKVMVRKKKVSDCHCAYKILPYVFIPVPYCCRCCCRCQCHFFRTKHNFCNSHMNGEILREQPWFQPGIPRSIVVEILQNAEPGMFIVRQCADCPNNLALSLKVPEYIALEGILHYIICKEGHGYRLKGSEKWFESLYQLVVHHSVMPEILPVTLNLDVYEDASKLKHYFE